MKRKNEVRRGKRGNQKRTEKKNYKQEVETEVSAEEGIWYENC